MIYYFLLLILIISCILLLFKPRILENFGLKFVHIPKNAGTSIEKIGEELGFSWGFNEWTKKDIKEGDDIFHHPGPFINIHNNKIPKNENCYPWHRTPDKLGDTFYTEDDELFCIVRNPYTKFISAYNYGNKETSVEGVNNFIKEKLSDFENNKYWGGCHILPQYYFTHGKRKCDNILKFENLDNEFYELMEKHNIKVNKIEKKNISNKKKISVDDLSRESLDLINRVYDKDFELFDYEKL